MGAPGGRLRPEGGRAPGPPAGTDPDLRAALAVQLARAGCVAAEEEAAELVGAAADRTALAALLSRRLAGEPLAWVTGSTRFCGVDVAVDPGVYVPRWQSQALARQAARLLPADGVAVDLCTGSGAIALVLRSVRPGATVVATEIDPVAAACARRNGVAVHLGDLDGPLPAELARRVDVLVAVPPYVPAGALHLLPGDARVHEPLAALVGGATGLDVVTRIVTSGLGWLRPGGWLLLEVGIDQVAAVHRLCADAGYGRLGVHAGEDGEPRGVLARRGR